MNIVILVPGSGFVKKQVELEVEIGDSRGIK